MEETKKELFTRLLLIRHGQTQHNVKGIISGHSDTPINDTGHKQAHLMAKRVKEQFPIDVIYASPLQRAMQTAQYLAQEVDLPIQPHPDLIEFSFGELSDQPLSELQKRNPTLYQQIIDWNEVDSHVRTTRPQIPGFEPLEAFKARLQSFTDMLLEQHGGQHVAAVTHGGFIKSYVYYLIGGNFDTYIPFWVDNTSITIIDFYKGNPMVRLFNDNSHIGERFDYGRPRLL